MGVSEVIAAIIVLIGITMVAYSLIYILLAEYRLMKNNSKRLEILSQLQRHTNFRLCQIYRNQLKGGSNEG